MKQENSKFVDSYFGLKKKDDYILVALQLLLLFFQKAE